MLKEAGFTVIAIVKHFSYNACNTAVIFIVLCKNPLASNIVTFCFLCVLLLSILKSCVLENDFILLSRSVLALLVTG